MTTDNENGNGVVTTEPDNQASCDAKLIAGELTKGFQCLSKEMDDRERLAERRIERKEKTSRWVMFILLIFSVIALPPIAYFIRDLRIVMEDMSKNMGEMSSYMETMKGSMTAMSSDMSDMRDNMANMDTSMATMNRTMQAMTGHVSMMDFGMRNMNYSVRDMDQTMQYPMRSIGNMLPWRW